MKTFCDSVNGRNSASSEPEVVLQAEGMFKPTYITLWVAFAGPGIIAALSILTTAQWDSDFVRVGYLLLFTGLLAAVFYRAHYLEGLTLWRLGFRPLRVMSLGTAAGLITFFVFLFGPFAFWLVSVLGLGSFAEGMDRLANVPTPILALNILVVAGGEEWLYRCYGIERLKDLTGNIWLAGLLSLIAFAVVHVPFWGAGPALTALISGAILTMVYIWTRDIAALIVAHIAVDFHGLILAG